MTDFNPLVVRGVVYGRGPGNSFVALDAATGKQLWAHPPVDGFNGRGVNYWESTRRQEPPPDLQRQQLPAGDRRASPARPVSSFGVDGKVDLRVGLDRDPATINAADHGRRDGCSRT